MLSFPGVSILGSGRICECFSSLDLDVEMAAGADGEWTRVLAAQFALIALAFDWRLPRFSSSSSTARPSLPRAAHYKTQYTLAVLTALSLLATLWHASWPRVVPRPHREAARIVRAGIWTVHFGIDNEGRDSQRRMRDLIKCVLCGFCFW